MSDSLFDCLLALLQEIGYNYRRNTSVW